MLLMAGAGCGRIGFAPTEPDASAEPVTMLTAIAAPALLTSSDTHLYWTSFSSQVVSCAKADCSGTVMPIAAVPEMTHGIAIDETRVYWTNSSASAVEACPLAGCGAAPPTVIASGLAGAYMLAVERRGESRARSRTRGSRRGR